MMRTKTIHVVVAGPKSTISLLNSGLSVFTNGSRKPPAKQKNCETTFVLSANSTFFNTYAPDTQHKPHANVLVNINTISIEPKHPLNDVLYRLGFFPNVYNNNNLIIIKHSDVIAESRHGIPFNGIEIIVADTPIAIQHEIKKAVKNKLLNQLAA